jgi:hypothetical protein
MKEILLTQGKVALVDDEDFDRVNQYKWYYNAYKGYATTNITVGPGKQKGIYMHRLIANTPSGMLTDHRDLDKLNNQKSNLRTCTSTQNCRNKAVQKNKKSSRFKGVFIQRDNRSKSMYWSARIVVNKKQFCKNYPFTPTGEIAAAQTYNDWAQQHFKEFAVLNDLTI